MSSDRSVKRKHSPGPQGAGGSSQTTASASTASTGSTQRPRYFAPRPPGQPPGRVAGFVKPVPFGSGALTLTQDNSLSGSAAQTGSGPLRNAVHVPFTLQKPPEHDSSARGSAASSGKSSRSVSRAPWRRGDAPSSRQQGDAGDVNPLSGLGQALSGLDLRGKAPGSRRSSRASSISLS